MARLRTLALLSIAAVSGCPGSDPPTDPGGGSVAFVSVHQAQYSGIGAYRLQTITSAAQWASVWAEIHLPASEAPPLPPVDFAGQRLLLAAAGERPNGCYSLAVESIARRGSGLEATLVETVPGSDCACTLAITQPLHVVSLQRSEEAIAGRTVRRAARCS